MAFVSDLAAPLRAAALVTLLLGAAGLYADLKLKRKEQMQSNSR